MKREKVEAVETIGGRIRLEPGEKSFLIDGRGVCYRIYMDELSQMFAIAFQAGLLDLRVVAHAKGQSRKKSMEGKFFIELKDEKWWEQDK